MQSGMGSLTTNASADRPEHAPPDPQTSPTTESEALRNSDDDMNAATHSESFLDWQENQQRTAKSLWGIDIGMTGLYLLLATLLLILIKWMR
jgi:hypothetical protein